MDYKCLELGNLAKICVLIFKVQGILQFLRQIILVKLFTTSDVEAVLYLLYFLRTQQCCFLLFCAYALSLIYQLCWHVQLGVPETNFRKSK
jgi:hypothetical protein